jgi:hypothetical protein
MRRAIATILACCLITAAPISMPTQAQEPFVIVPDHPQGVPINGCYTANRQLFGPYRFSFCLVRPGSYSVRGGGVSCDGRLTWRASGRDIHADIHRVSCGGGLAWERARMDCRPVGILGIIGGASLSSLRCTYHPTVRHQRRQTFIANRN